MSAELFAIPLSDGRHLVYAPRRRAAFVANAVVVNFIADLKRGIFDPAVDRDGGLVRLLRRLEILDAGPEPLPITTFKGPPRPTSLTLFLTTTCNLRCTYCYASAGNTPAKSMSIQTARRGIDFVAENARRRGVPSIEVDYHGGGEPTGNWAVMTASLDYARGASRARGLAPPRASCATNAVLRDDQIDWILENLHGASVSVDGPPEVHDRHRRTPLGRGSSHRVIHTLRRFDASGFRYGVRLTVTADSLDQLPDSVEYVCAHFRPERIQVEPAYPMGRWRDAPSAETEAFIDAFRAGQSHAARCGRQIEFSAARLGTLTNHFCGVTQDTFALSPDGNVSACYEAFTEEDPRAGRFFYAKPKIAGSGYRIERRVLDSLRRQTVEHRAFCDGCFARWSCAGDCYYRYLSVNGDVEFQGTERCHITRELTKDQILGRIAAAGGSFWHEPPAVEPRGSREKERKP